MTSAAGKHRVALTGLMPLWLAIISWAVFAATRAPVVSLLADGAGEVVWLWPRAGILITWALCGALVPLAGFFLQILWLGSKGLARYEAFIPAARAWRAAPVMLILPLGEFLPGLTSLTVIPLAVGREMWPFMLVVMLTAAWWNTFSIIPPKEAPIKRRSWLPYLVVALALGAAAFMGMRIHDVAKRHGVFMGGDEPQYLFNTHTLAVDRDLDLADNVMLRENSFFLPPNKVIGGHSSWTKSGQYVSKHRPGLPALLAPFYAWGLYLGKSVYRFSSLAMWLLSAWLALEVFLFARSFTKRDLPAFLAAMASCLAMPNLIYSNLVFTELAAAAFSLAAFRRIAMGPGAAWHQLFLAGLFAGYLPWLHERFILLSLILFLFWLWQKPWQRPWGIAAFLAPLCASALLMMRYYMVLYGGPFPTIQVHARGSYLNPRGVWEGLAGILVDGAEGLFPYGAVWLAGISGLIWICRQRLAFGLWVSAMAMATYLTAGLYVDWFGGINPPARYLVAATPFCALGFAVGWVSGGGRFKVWSIYLAFFTALAAWVVLVAPNKVYGHEVILGRNMQFPLIAALMPDFIASPRPAEQNALCALLWFVVCAGVILWMQCKEFEGVKPNSVMGIVSAYLMLVLIGVFANIAGPGLLKSTLVPNQVTLLNRAAQASPLGFVQGGSLESARKGKYTYIDLSPADHIHPPGRKKTGGDKSAYVEAGIKPGLFVWGQYLPLPAGRYKLTVKVDTQVASGQVGWLDAAYDLGRKVVLKKSVMGTGSSHVISGVFKLDHPVRDLECRVGSLGEIPFSVSSMRLNLLLP